MRLQNIVNIFPLLNALRISLLIAETRDARTIPNASCRQHMIRQKMSVSTTRLPNALMDIRFQQSEISAKEILCVQAEPTILPAINARKTGLTVARQITHIVLLTMSAS